MNDNKLNCSSVILSLKIYYCKRFLQTHGKQTHLNVPVMLLQTSYVSAILQQCLQKGSYYLQTLIFFVMTSLLETFVFRNGIRSDLNVSWKESRKAHRNAIDNNLWILKITHKQLQNTTEDNYEKELDYAWTHQYGQERCEWRPNAFLSDSSQEDDLDHFKDCAREFAYT